MKVLGIDEAGRGCILGPMIVASVAFPKEKEGEVMELGIRDSKKLSPQRREEIYEKMKILSYIEIQISRVSPKEIDENNMTLLTQRSAVELILQSTASQIFLDVPAPPASVEKYLSHLRNLTSSKEIAIEGANRGEEKYLCVAAASIAAKVNRDRILSEIQEEERFPFGSGYPSDPKTVHFLQELLKNSQPLPDFVRKKWKTLHNLKQGTLWEEI